MRSGRINIFTVPPDFKAKASSCTHIHCTDNGCLPSEPTQPKPSVRPRKSIHKTHGHRNPTVCGSLVTVTVKLLLFLFGLCDDYTTILNICQVNFSKIIFSSIFCRASGTLLPLQHAQVLFLQNRQGRLSSLLPSKPCRVLLRKAQGSQTPLS